MNTTIDWIPAGQAFALDDLVFWQGKGDAPFTAMAARIDTIVLGPRATAHLERPGDDWPAVDGPHLGGIGAGLVAAACCARNGFPRPMLCRRSPRCSSDRAPGTALRMCTTSGAHPKRREPGAKAP